jgi:DDE superfamily endonuclease
MYPFSAGDLQKYLADIRGFRCSRFTLQRYMKEELGLSYKGIKNINPLFDSPEAKLQRQFAASQFLINMTSGHTIINIDESSLYETDTRRKTWAPRSKKKFLTKSRRLTSVSMIAAISNKGEFYFSINQGRNNSYTLLLFLIRLIKHFNRFKRNWRATTIFMLDNASYHKSDFIKQCFRELKI